MLDFGFSEILLTSAIALVVLGPERLPKVARQVGNWMGRARVMARQLTEQLDREISAEEILRQQQKPAARSVPIGAASPPPVPAISATPAAAATPAPSTNGRRAIGPARARAAVPAATISATRPSRRHSAARRVCGGRALSPRSAAGDRRLVTDMGPSRFRASTREHRRDSNAPR